MTVDTVFTVGDWIVHNAYGIGQIKKIEKKPIHGEKIRAFRVKIKDGFYWLPLKRADNPRVRRVVTKRKLRRAIRMINRKPKKMAKNYKTRNKRIKKDLESGSIYKMARLMRDLLALRETKNWNNTEKDAFDRMTELFAREYSICHDVNIGEARAEMAEIISD
jgi:CarD family transcriptional regulator